MKTKVLFLYLLSLSLFQLKAQKIDKELIYTLPENHRIANNEHEIFINLNKTGYFFVEGLSNSYSSKIEWNAMGVSDASIIYNGNKLGPYDEIDELVFNDKANASSIINYYIYSLNGKRYLKTGDGQQFGPYESIYVDRESTTELMLVEKKGMKYFLKNGVEYGPFQDIESSRGDSIYCYKKENMWHLFYYGKTYGPYNDIDNHSNSNMSFFSYTKNNKKFFHIDNNDYGPYDEIFHDDIIIRYNKSQNIFYFSYLLNNKFYLNINGLDFGPFEKEIFPKIFKNGKIYYEYSKEGKDYISVTGNILGPYDKINGFTVTEKGDFYAFLYKKDNIGYYYNINGKIYGPYSGVQYFTSSSTGLTIFDINNDFYFLFYNSEDKLAINKNGVNLDVCDSLIMYSVDQDYEAQILFWKNNQLYFIDGNNKFGPYDKIIDSHYFSYYQEIIFQKNSLIYVYNNHNIYGPFNEYKNKNKYGEIENLAKFVKEKKNYFITVVR